MIKPITTPGKTYAVTSPNGCTVTQRVGEATIVHDVPAGVQVLIIAQAARMEVSDDAAVVTECGGSAELVFTAATTRAASSGSGCDCGFTAEECDKLKLYASAEGRNVPISDDGEIVTEVGHTYTITAGEQAVKCTDADFNPLCEVAAHKQMGFVAPATAAYVDPITCTVTELFRAAAPVELSGNGSGILNKEVAKQKLPQGYTQIQYLEATGTQHVDSGIHASGRMNFVLILETLQNYGGAFLGGRGSNQRGNLFLFENSVNGVQFDYLMAQPVKFRAIPFYKYKIETKLGGLFADGLPLTEQTHYLDFEEDANIFLFAFNRIGEVCYYLNKARIFYLQLSYMEDVQREFIPALDDTGAPCLYDTVTQQAYYNQGTGDFIYPSESANYALRRALPDWGQLTPHGLRRLYHTPEDYTGELIDYAIENGYKRIVESEAPTEGYWSPQWRETAEEIVLDWIETEEPEMEEV